MTPGIAYLDGPRLRRCLMAGLQQLAEQREYLNRINVFPVPDGDTGNNLAHTALAGLQSLANTTSSHAGELFSILADATLDAAQGNSGTLLAQLLQGMAAGTDGQSRIGTTDFARALTHAAVTTRKALDTPREGTIISVIDASASAARHYADCSDYRILLPAMRDAALVALTATTSQLDVLRKAGVVDAGAAGYCALLEGCTDFLLHGSMRAVIRAPVVPNVFTVSAEHGSGNFEFRYCTECTLVGVGLDQSAIRSVLHELGDSMVIAGSTQRLRIHIHTSDPEAVFRNASQFGTLQATKADDMQSQTRSLGRSNRAVAIVTDSAADLPADLVARLDIHVVPLRINFGSASYLDKIEMDASEFAAELLTNPERPGTSQPTPGDLRRMYEFLLTHFSEILSINLSSKLSGTWQAASAAAAALDSGERIKVLDSASVSVGQGMIVKRVAEHAAAGLTGTLLLTAAHEEIAAVRSFALVTDLSNAVRSGRLKPAIKRMADWLHLTPVLANTGTGAISMHGFLPGRHRLIERFARYIARAAGTAGKWELAIASGATRSADARLLQSELEARLPGVSEIWQTEIGPALGLHTGMTALVVSLRKLP